MGASSHVDVISRDILVNYRSWYRMKAALHLPGNQLAGLVCNYLLYTAVVGTYRDAFRSSSVSEDWRAAGSLQ